MCLSQYTIGKVREPRKVSRLTKMQREAMALRPKLDKGLRSKVHAARQEFEQHGYYSRSRQLIWCEACGSVHHAEFPALALGICDYRCPHCGRHIHVDEVEVWSKKPRYDAIEYGYVTHIGSWTVLRVFYVERTCKMEQKVRYDVHEVWQRWLNDNGKEVILTKHYYRSPYYFRWCFDSDWKVGRHNGGCSGYYVSNDMYDSYGVTMGAIDVSDMLKRNGWRNEWADLRVDIFKFWQLLLTEPMAEECAKHNQEQVVKYWMTNCNKPFLQKWMHAVRICIRNHYKIKDAPLWFDHMELLEHFGKDTHNAHYVCPANLSEEHHRLIMRQQRELAAKELQEQIATINDAEPAFREHRGMFFGLFFGDGDITVKVLCSVRDIFEEGTMMKHCVFTNRYYDTEMHPDSLILSARDSHGERIETVEVNIRTWQIVQSRGFMNGMTDRHADIVRLVNKNMNLLKLVV